MAHTELVSWIKQTSCFVRVIHMVGIWVFSFESDILKKMMETCDDPFYFLIQMTISRPNVVFDIPISR